MLADTYIPRRLDDQWKIGLWDVDVAAPVLFMLFVGYLANTLWGFAVACAIGLYFARMMARAKADKHAAYALHWLYWYLPTNPVSSMRATPPSHIRRMVG
ncbi:conjugal transfer protein TraL [Massilia sp. Root351]|jgi:conjugal transfer pilus assembly protein TraL|uniref:type IV conjugative transfer system protein TraL n=1 Tax=Massilia sp. Root351 TaxID=1736522 RepID=UPI00070BA67F|nr:type IV conjugative transfer system protein TraL [Massilia sp. Root351]KQV80991.1 conjugal transfer protein TraL [Massilia sp. Root351]